MDGPKSTKSRDSHTTEGVFCDGKRLLSRSTSATEQLSQGEERNSSFIAFLSLSLSGNNRVLLYSIFSSSLLLLTQLLDRSNHIIAKANQNTPIIIMKQLHESLGCIVLLLNKTMYHTQLTLSKCATIHHEFILSSLLTLNIYSYSYKLFHFKQMVFFSSKNSRNPQKDDFDHIVLYSCCVSFPLYQKIL